jgi:hypothetical protein
LVDPVFREVSILAIKESFFVLSSKVSMSAVFVVVVIVVSRLKSEMPCVYGSALNLGAHVSAE